MVTLRQLPLLAAAAAAVQARSAKDIASAAEAMVLGSFVADAAGMSLHWIYSQSEIADLVGSGSPIFFSPPSCPFYNYPLGSGTPYGQQTEVTLSVGAAGGGWAPSAYEAAYYALYKAGGPASKAAYYFDVRVLRARERGRGRR